LSTHDIFSHQQLTKGRKKGELETNRNDIAFLHFDAHVPFFINYPLSLIFILLCFFSWGHALFFSTLGYAAENNNALLFLPLKINTAQERKQLQELTDRTLSEALVKWNKNEKIFHFMPRQKAQQELDYNGAWPPSINTLQELVEKASVKTDNLRYIAAGSLTRLGQRISVDLKVYDLLHPDAATYYYQDNKTLENLGKAIDQILTDILKHTSRNLLVGEVILKGNERIDSGAVLRQIKTRTGDRYDPQSLTEDMKRVFKMGYFDDVRISTQETAKGKEIIFELKEKPVIGQILLEGTKELKEETVREAVTITSNTIVNPKKVKEAADNIRSLYREKGFYDTKVTTKLSYPKPDRVDIRFVIEEGPKIYTKEVKFVGNNAFKARKLKKVIETSTRGFFSWLTDSGLLKRDVLEQDVARLTAYYHNHGYIEAKVGEPEIVQKGKWLYVTFNIFEGDRYKVGNITLTGDFIADQNDLLRLFELRKEEYLSRKILREDILRFTDFYAENGYAFAEVNPFVHEREADKSVDITINIQKGDLVYLNRILISGNTRTRDKVIRRELDIKEKGIFNSKGIRDSHEKLQRLDYFEEINITPEPTLEKNMMNVKVEVKEKPTGSFSIGAGYSSVDNLLVMGEISQNNFLGKGQRLALQANLGSTSNRYNISFTEPHYKDSQLLVGLDVYNWKREYTDYTKDSYGGALRFGYPVWELWKMNFSYGYDKADLTDVKENASQIIKDSVDIHVTSFTTLGFWRDTRNRRFDASKGSRNAINVKYAGGPLGGDSAFTKIEAASSWYFPLFWEVIYHLKFAAGQLFEDKSGKLPVFEKFYLGGIRTIRGFNSNHISPKDPTTDERIGGKKMWFMNAEWIFPLVKEAGLKGLIFFDAGNVYEDEWEFDFIKKSVGTGFRWLSPVGPLRLEWGYVIDPVEDEDQSNWDFSIGGEF